MDFMIKRLPGLCLTYLIRLQRINIKGTLSDKQELNFGVPQGSILEPILYCLYTKPVPDIIHCFGLLHHSYADDT